MAPRWVDAGWAATVGLLARLGMVFWAAGSIPPVADGEYYQVVATRIADGLGYTWLWPDGTVTYAAHYPVGYPALVGALYAILGNPPVVAMGFNAALGTVAVVAVHRIAASLATRRGALLAALLVALHPALVAYTPALMTEGVVAALLVLAIWGLLAAQKFTGRAHWFALAAVGLLFGITTLVRPQIVIAVPLLAVLLAGGHRPWRWRGMAARVVLVAGVAVATCLPWTFRNCFMMNSAAPGQFDPRSCLFVSANGGWNLLIGSGPGATGVWVPIEQVGVPDECREVYGEADKDRCFGRAGVRHILARPGRWLGLIPRKLAVTFNSSGAAGWYLHTANPERFSATARRFLDGFEIVFQRGVVLLGLLAMWRGRRRYQETRRLADRLLPLVLLLGAVSCLSPSGWIAYLALVVAGLLLGRRMLLHPPAAAAVVVVGTTALTHVVFFGAGRYSLVCYAVLAALAGAALPSSASDAAAANRF